MPKTERPLLGHWPGVGWATFIRDMWIATSYPLGFLLTAGGSIFSMVGVFFLSQAFGHALVTPVQRYGGDYFAFGVVGVALSSFMGVGLSGVGMRIREGQMMGTLELMLLSPNRLASVLLSSSLWSHALALVTLMLCLVVGVALGMDLSHANVLMACASLVLAIIAFNALGLVAASVVIVIKQGSPVTVVLGMASALAGGVLYPTSVLPSWLQGIGQVLPLTHALELVRRSVLRGEGIDTLWGPFLSLVILTAVMLPAGLWACDRAVHLAQTDGSLSQY
jgi:ABC-2 type transport system permease protein